MTLTAEIAPEKSRAARPPEPVERPAAEGPSADTRETWQLIANISVTGLFALSVLAVLYLMKEVAVPVILAWVVANILLPLIGWLEKRGVPRVFSVIVVTLALVAVL